VDVPHEEDEGKKESRRWLVEFSAEKVGVF